MKGKTNLTERTSNTAINNSLLFVVEFFFFIPTLCLGQWTQSTEVNLHLVRRLAFSEWPAQPETRTHEVEAFKLTHQV